MGDPAGQGTLGISWVFPPRLFHIRQIHPRWTEDQGQIELFYNQKLEFQDFEKPAFCLAPISRFANIHGRDSLWFWFFPKATLRCAQAPQLFHLEHESHREGFVLGRIRSAHRSRCEAHRNSRHRSLVRSWSQRSFRTSSKVLITLLSDPNITELVIYFIIYSLRSVKRPRTKPPISRRFALTLPDPSWKKNICNPFTPSVRFSDTFFDFFVKLCMPATLLIT